MWLCENCSDGLRREIEVQRATLRREVSAAMERMLLADEVDPGEVGVTRNLQVLRKRAHEIDCAVPGTAALIARLDPDGNRETKVLHSFPSDLADGVCYFCRKNAPSPRCEIGVPVCGDKHTVPRLLGGRSTRIKVATVSVPRCQACHDAHTRRRRWEIDYEDAGCAAATGVKGRLEKSPSTIGALICLAVGLLIRDGRAGIDVPAVFTAMVDHATPELELAARLSPVACGLLAGGAVTAWLMRSARRRRARNVKLFQAKRPEPQLPAGIEPESSYVNFPKLKELLQQNWSFGQVYRPERKEPMDVKGLVLAAS